VSDDQVITQAIKVLRVGPQHSHLVRERFKTVPELYDKFIKFSKSEVRHFCKLEQQSKIPKLDEAPRPCYSDNQCNYPKPLHNIDSDGYGPPENWEENFRGPSQERNSRTFDQRSPQYNKRGRASNCGWRRGRGPYTINLHTACTMAVTPIIEQKIIPSTLRAKRKWSKIRHNLRTNSHPEKSTTPSNGLRITSDIPCPTICIFQPKPTKIAKPNLRHITSHIAMPQPIILNLC
jgi:hypothetical protein